MIRSNGAPSSGRVARHWSGRTLLDAVARCMRGYQVPAGPADLARLRRPDRALFEAARRRGQPVLLDGLLDDVPDRETLDLPGLRARLGERLVSVIRTNGGRIEDDTENGLAFDTVRFADYVDRIVRGEPVATYLAVPAQTWLPELLQQVRCPEYCRDAAWTNARFWLGPAQTCTPLHRDVAENIFVQLVGRKRFILYPAAATPWLYSNPIRSALPNFSRFDPEHPDDERFPLACAVRPLEVVLRPGEAIYLPSRWWHQVRSLDLSASLNFWFADGWTASLVRTAEFVKRVRRLEIYGLEAREGAAVGGISGSAR